MEKLGEGGVERKKFKKVLCVEGDPQVQDLYRNWFKKKGFDVSVKSLEEAVQSPEGDADLIVVEPGTESAGSAISRLRETYPSQHIVIASGRGDIIHEIKDPKLFPNTSALTKPFHMEELQELAEVLLSGDWKTEVSEDKTLN